MKIQATTRDAYKLLHDGDLALEDIEYNGIRVDTAYCEKTFKKLERDMSKSLNRVKKTDVHKKWKKKYGSKINLDSNDQLADIIFNVMGHTPEIFTPTGKPSTKEDSLVAVGLPAVGMLIELRQTARVMNKLDGIYRETIDGFMHPSFNLHTAITYRSSSNNPNFQNMDVRNPITAEIVRRAMVSRPGYQIGEIDYGGIEVKGATWYHHDPRMMDYLNDPTKDMHRDMAMQCYKLKKKQVSKNIRYCGKNQFVFPEFYGDYYKSCARSLWESITSMKLKTEDEGVGLRKHLKNEDIRDLQDFESHIKDVEDDFWNNRFQVYGKWKVSHYNRYLQRGYIDTLSGFRCSGEMKKNEAINYPIQGIAFHCLLWSLIRLNKQLKKYKMKTKLIGQVHDSIVADIYRKERKVYLEMVQQIMCVDIKKHWKFICTPLEIEAELAPVNGSWFEKKEVTIG